MGSQTPARPVIFRVPKENPPLIVPLATKYRDLRLQGLKLSPSSFSSTLEIESTYTDAVWQSRLLRPGFETFICMTEPAIGDKRGIEGITSPSAQWVAQLTLRGPLSYDDFRLTPESDHVPQSILRTEDEERWQVLSLYVHPDCRGQGIAVRICEDAFAWLHQRDSQDNDEFTAVNGLRLRAIIKPDNAASRALFQKKLGFSETGSCTLPQALRANGEVVPEALAQKERRGTIARGPIVYTKFIKRTLS